MQHSLKSRVRALYKGREPAAVRFRYGLIAFDALSIIFLIVSAPMESTPVMSAVTYAIGIVILTDFLARLWIEKGRVRYLTRIYTIADIVVVLSLFLDPLLPVDLSFLRVLRGLRLIHSYQLLYDLRRDSPFFRKHEEVVIATVNLAVFVFVTASAVFAFFFVGDAEHATYIDALYFTVATLTTTGFGDITLTTQAGKLFSVFVMIVGVSLFVQLARAIVTPSKVQHKCRECGLLRHERDAVHCKHCGAPLKIETPGQD